MLAISVGNLISKTIGARTKVISEPNVVDKDADELSELEDLLTDTENYMNPPNAYMWGSYAIIV